MQVESLAQALTGEHHQIDAGIAAFTANPADREPLTRAIGALRRHIYLEEEFLFPLLYHADKALAAPLAVMLRDHAQMWDTLDRLARGPDPDTRVALCKRLTLLLLHHNLNEEKTVYPRADDLLQAAAVSRLRAFLGTAELPTGWVCINARAVPQVRAVPPG